MWNKDENNDNPSADKWCILWEGKVLPMPINVQ